MASLGHNELNHNKSKHNRTLGIYCGRYYFFTPETKSCHNANFVIIDSTGGCHNDNLQGPPGMTKLASWQFWVFTVDRKLCINVAPSSAHQLTMPTMSTEVREREREIKFIGLFENRGHRGPYSPYKPFNHNLYIGIIIFPHIDNPQYTGYYEYRGKWTWFNYPDGEHACLNQQNHADITLAIQVSYRLDSCAGLFQHLRPRMYWANTHKGPSRDKLISGNTKIFSISSHHFDGAGRRNPIMRIYDNVRHIVTI